MPHRVANAPKDPNMNGHTSHPAPALTLEQLAEWDEFEERFFRDYEEKKRQEDAAAKRDYEVRKADITVVLTQCQREKAAHEKKVKASAARIAMLQDGLDELDREYNVHVLNVNVSRNRAHFDLQERFAKSREAGPLNADLVRQLRCVGPSMMPFPVKAAGAHGAVGAQSPPATPPDVGAHEKDVDSDSTGVVICRFEGKKIGEVEKLTSEPRVAKHAVKMLLDLPVRRPVVIREGRRFGPADLDGIHQSNDGRFSKWLSCMIQAVGDENSAPCDICRRGAGPFVSCVRVDGASPRCGNCEWSRRGCQTQADDADDQYASTLSDAEANDSTAQRQPRKAQRAKARGVIGDEETRAGGRRQIDPAVSYAESAATRDGSVDAREETPADPTPQFDPETLVSPVITLRHDGRVYTEPELMAGVPLEKIDKDHPYWDPAWKDPDELIRTIRSTLASHEEKHSQLIQGKDKSINSKYFHGRQINRGRLCLEFLDKGPFHPFQVVGKKWITPGITTYDTLFRLADTLDELAKFRITVTPEDWLRQRLCEIMEAQGDGFNLANSVKSLYHDPKVQALRQMSGFGNVGRPVKGGPPRKKRKRRDGAGATPSKRARTDGPVPVPAPADGNLEYEGHTDTDSVCGETVTDGDFRVRRVRNGRYTTSEGMTQYWHLFPDIGFDLVLLQSVDPPRWMGPRVDGLSAAMGDIGEVAYHPESEIVRVALLSGEEVMVWFWRERTKRRLVALCRERGRDVKVAES